MRRRIPRDREFAHDSQFSRGSQFTRNNELARDGEAMRDSGVTPGSEFTQGSECTRNDDLTRGSEFSLGWPVVLACFCLAVFAWGFGFYGQSVYLAALRDTRGWSTSLISGATTTYYLSVGCSSPRPGTECDRAVGRARRGGVRRAAARGRDHHPQPRTRAVAALRERAGDGRRLGLHLDHGHRRYPGAAVRSAARIGDQAGTERRERRRADGGPGTGRPQPRDRGVARRLRAGRRRTARLAAGTGHLSPPDTASDTRPRRRPAAADRSPPGIRRPHFPPAGPGVLVRRAALRARPVGAGRLHCAPGGVPAAVARRRKRRQRGRADRRRGPRGTLVLSTVIDRPQQRRTAAISFASRAGGLVL